ncbi:MAG TPA: lysylphosphatidylglycerol synthase transmembrane domain-containing protein [Thermoanaerobaculia bacterium]|nr:lysylphosphatidylglycerol synthase transmembrane domain-containing protein [Thermoanaerobaculia bacterium]
MTSPAPTPESRLKRLGILLLKVGISVLALYLTWRLLAGLDWRELTHRLEEASWLYLTPAILFLLARWAAWDWRFRLAAREAVGLSPGSVLGYFVLKASAALNLITPSARLIGGLMRARYFARAAGRPFGVLYGVVLYDQIAHHFVMTTATWTALIATAWAIGRTGFSLAAAAALVAVAAGLVVWSRRGRFETNPLVRFLARRAERAEGRMQSFYSHGHEAVHVFVRLLARPRLHLRAVLLGMLYVIFNVGAQWLVFLALDQPISLLVVFAGVSLGMAAGTLTGTPGGLGTTEAAMVASFAALGVDRVDAAAGTLLFRGLHYATVLGLGLPALLFLEFRLPQTPAEAAGEEG